MEIKTPSVVALTWTLKDTLGEVLDTLNEPVEFFIGGQDLLPKIEEALQGHGARWPRFWVACRSGSDLVQATNLRKR